MTCFECGLARYRYPHPVEQQDIIVISNFNPRANNYTMNKMYFVTLMSKRPFYSYVLSYWPVNANEAGGELAFLETSTSLHKNNLIYKSSAVFIKIRSPTASLPFRPGPWTHKYKAVYRWFQIKISQMPNYKIFNFGTLPHCLAVVIQAPFWMFSFWRQ